MTLFRVFAYYVKVYCLDSSQTSHDCCCEQYTVYTYLPVNASSLHPIPTVLLHDCLDVLIKPLTLFINICLNHGVFSEQFKLALVSPLLEKPSLSKEELKNYGPDSVSNLNYNSKLLERVVAGQLNCYLQDNKLVNPFQSAYKAGHSTESALLKIKSDIHRSLLKGYCTALTLLDLSAT